MYANPGSSHPELRSESCLVRRRGLVGDEVDRIDNLLFREFGCVFAFLQQAKTDRQATLRVAALCYVIKSGPVKGMTIDEVAEAYEVESAEMHRLVGELCADVQAGTAILGEPKKLCRPLRSHRLTSKPDAT